MWSGAELEAILDAIPARVTWWDARQRLRYVNATAEGLLDEPRATALGRPLAGFLGDQWMHEHGSYFEGVARGEPQQFPRVAVKDGVEHHSEIRLCPVATGGFAVFSLDSTAMMVAQREARLRNARSAVMADRQRIAGELGVLVIEELRSAKDDLVRGDAGQARTRLDHVIASLRSTIRSLRAPEVLEDVVEEQADTESGTQPLQAPGRPAHAVPSLGLNVLELKGVLDSLPVAITAWDKDYVNTFANAAAVECFGFGSAEAVHGRRASEVLSETQYQASLAYGEEAKAGRPQKFIRTLPHPGGGVRHSQVDYVAQVIDGQVVGVVSLVLDVTERVAAEAATVAAAERFTVLSDRARIAEDLHDLVIQRVFAASLLLTLAEQKDADFAPVISCVEDALVELGESIHELHGESITVRFGTALDRLIRQASRQLGFTPTFVSAGRTDDLPTKLVVDVLAVVSEALSNAARHASASQVEVRIEVRPHELRLRVVDDGVGISEDESRRSGLANLQSRAARHAGHFAFRRNTPRGTVVEWSASLAG